MIGKGQKLGPLGGETPSSVSDPQVPSSLSQVKGETGSRC